MNNNPFGQQNQNTDNSGNNPFETPSTNPFGSTNSNPFGSTSTNPFGSTTNVENITAPANTVTSTPVQVEATFLDGNTNYSSNTSGMVGSMQDNSLNLYNLTLREIVEKQAAILSKNIVDFQKSARSVFEQDMKLIAAKNTYINVQNKIKGNTLKMNELIEAIDYFANELDKYDTKTENTSENAKVIGEFEALCDKFYEKVEDFNDENNGVMDLINENYALIEKLDGLLDELEVKSKIQ